MYIETSPPRVANEKARILSPVQAAGTTCLSFYYNMFGESVNALNVYVKTSPALGSPIFTKSGTQGRAWQQALIDIKSAVQYQVRGFWEIV